MCIGIDHAAHFTQSEFELEGVANSNLASSLGDFAPQVDILTKEYTSDECACTESTLSKEAEQKKHDSWCTTSFVHTASHTRARSGDRRVAGVWPGHLPT